MSRKSGLGDFWDMWDAELKEEEEKRNREKILSGLYKEAYSFLENEPDKAIDILLEHKKEFVDSSYVGAFYGLLALSYKNIGNYEKVLSVYDEGIQAACEKHNSTMEEALKTDRQYFLKNYGG